MSSSADSSPQPVEIFLYSSKFLGFSGVLFSDWGISAENISSRKLAWEGWASYTLADYFMRVSKKSSEGSTGEGFSVKIGKSNV